MTDQPETAAALLKPLATAVVPGNPAPVRIRDLFKNDIKVRFSTVYAEFKNRFFDKTEPPAAEMTCRQYKLLRISADGPILAALGGETRAESPFTAAFSLLQKQPKGEKEFLQTNGYANIFYIRDKAGTLCAVRIGWAEDGWVVDAISATDPLAWNGQHLIFSPQSVAGNI